MKTKSKKPVAAVYDRRNFLNNSKIISFAFFAFFVAISSPAQVQQAWVARYNNGLPTGTHQAVKMALDTNGNIYITGFSQNATNGNTDYATIKYAPNGNQVWASRFDSTNNTTAIPVAMVLDVSNNVIVIGTAGIVKYDSNGNHLWTALYTGTALATDTNCNICFVGYSSDFGTTKLSPTGTNIWSRTSPGAAGPAYSQKVAIDGNGNIYVAGNSTVMYFQHMYDVELELLKYDLNGNQLWDVFTGEAGFTPQVVGFTLDSSANLYVLANGHDLPYATFKYDANGNEVWDAFPIQNGALLAHGLTVDLLERATVTGEACPNANVYPNMSYGTGKLDANGTSLRTNYYPQIPTSTNVGTAITVDQGNNVYVTGYSPGTNSGNDIVTIKYDNNGNQIWVQSYNGPGNGDDEANAIAVDALGNVYVTGYDTTAAGGTEMVTIKYSPTASLTPQSNGTFLLQATGEPNESFDIQASTNLTNWLDLGLTNADTNGLLQFLDSNAFMFPNRFYLATPQ